MYKTHPYGTTEPIRYTLFQNVILRYSRSTIYVAHTSRFIFAGSFQIVDHSCGWRFNPGDESTGATNQWNQHARDGIQLPSLRSQPVFVRFHALSANIRSQPPLPILASIILLLGTELHPCANFLNTWYASLSSSFFCLLLAFTSRR